MKDDKPMPCLRCHGSKLVDRIIGLQADQELFRSVTCPRCNGMGTEPTWATADLGENRAVET